MILVRRQFDAHINPAMSLAFRLRGKMKTRAPVGYIVLQMLGAVVEQAGKQYSVWHYAAGQCRSITAAFIGEIK